MKSVEEILAELDRRIEHLKRAKRTHEMDALIALKQFITSPSEKHEHDEVLKWD